MNEEINYNIEQILKYLGELEMYDITNFEEFKKDTMKHLASSMCIFSILNSCIEIGERIIKLKNFQTPLKYREIFEILEQNNVISKKTSKLMQDNMYIRNMIAHQYGKVDLKKLYNIINEKNIFNKFIEEIKQYILSIS